MRILMSGSHGLIGSALRDSLTSQGHRVIPLIRPASYRIGEEQVQWDPATDLMQPEGLERFDAIIHLAGEPIAKARWTTEQKKKIWESRVEGTQFLCKFLAKVASLPKVLLCASAIGIYGNRGDEILREDSPAGTGFLAELAKAWEAAAHPVRQKGVRVVHLRFGVVLSPKGGALKMMLPPFRMGVGGRLGNGRQFMSWISIDDVVGAVQHLLASQADGPVNVVAPEPVTNREFTKILGRVLRRPTLFPVPPLALRIVFGELANEVLLASARVEPAQLKDAGYPFKYPHLEGALRGLLTP